MKPGLLIIPFLALLVAAVGTAIGSAFPTVKWIAGIGWASGAAMIVLWVLLDLANFKAMFLRKGAKYGASSGLVVVLGLLIITGLGVLTNKPRFDKSYDATKNKQNTLSDQSVKTVESINKRTTEIKAIAYFQDDQVRQQFMDLATLYLGRGAKLNIEYVDPQRDPMRAKADALTSANTVIFKTDTQESRITTFTEEKITNALVKVLKDKSKKVYFTKGHGEGQAKGTEAQGFSTMVAELENNKYEVGELSLLEEAKIPEDADLIIVAGPKYDFKEEEVRFLEDYLKRGGAMFAMVDAMTPVPNLNSLLGKFGLKVDDDLLILHPSDPRAALLGTNNAIVSEFDDLNPVTKDFARQSQVALVMPNTRSVDEVAGNPNNMKVSLVGKTSKAIIRVKNVKTPKDVEGVNINKDRVEAGSFAVVAVANGKPTAPSLASSSASPDSASKDKADASSTGGADSAKKEVRVVLVGSSAFASNGGAQAAEHRDMFVNVTSYLLQDDDFISIRPKDASKSTISLTSGSSQLLLLALAFIYPFVFLGGGLSYWLKRRRL